MNALVEECGLTSAHAIYLIALKLEDGMTMADLSRFLDMDPANTNRVIKVLKEKGYVYDDRKSSTSKKYGIFLTDNGKELAERIMEETYKSMSSYFEGIPREEILTMRNTLIRILDRMDPDIERYMKSKYENPYYTLLHTHPEDENLNEFITFKNKRRRKAR